MDNMEKDPKLTALSNIVNDLCKLFDTNLESLKQPKPLEKEEKEEEEKKVEVELELPTPANDTPDAMFRNLMKSKKDEI